MKFDMTIAQINSITCALETVNADGAVLEIGVGGGVTSIIMNKFMQEKSINSPFYAIDTFSRFAREDVDCERTVKGKVYSYLAYRSNGKRSYAKTLIAHGIKNARVIQSDAKEVDYSVIAPLAFLSG